MIDPLLTSLHIVAGLMIDLQHPVTHIIVLPMIDLSKTPTDNTPTQNCSSHTPQNHIVSLYQVTYDLLHRSGGQP
ncbi:hypothetical protein [Vibrio alginolyticus]|uniref:hypothetical protein n=1 Tax=Vibrio alginolyticus TaxID=663 RepID=UPI000B1D7D88|nr:hypothetical protein [Vibrio alginolyticus]